MTQISKLIYLAGGRVQGGGFGPSMNLSEVGASDLD